MDKYEDMLSHMFRNMFGLTFNFMKTNDKGQRLLALVAGREIIPFNFKEDNKVIYELQPGVFFFLVIVKKLIEIVKEYIDNADYHDDEWKETITHEFNIVVNELDSVILLTKYPGDEKYKVKGLSAANKSFGAFISIALYLSPAFSVITEKAKKRKKILNSFPLTKIFQLRSNFKKKENVKTENSGGELDSETTILVKDIFEETFKVVDEANPEAYLRTLKNERNCDENERYYVMDYVFNTGFQPALQKLHGLLINFPVQEGKFSFAARDTKKLEEIFKNKS